MRQLLVLLALSAFAAALVLGSRPVAVPVEQADVELSLQNDLEQVLIKQVSPAELSQQHINQALAAHALPAGIRQVSCELGQEVCKLFLTWQVADKLVTARVDLSVQRVENRFQVQILRGAYGHLEVPRGWLMPLRPVLEKLTATFKPEVEALFAIPRFHFAAEKLVLDPRF
jgi:hypothetical protein